MAAACRLAPADAHDVASAFAYQDAYTQIRLHRETFTQGSFYTELLRTVLLNCEVGMHLRCTSSSVKLSGKEGGREGERDGERGREKERERERREREREREREEREREREC